MLRAVAENASFTLAGQKLHVAQSAISRKIKLLEEELGEKLFKRVNRRVFLTPAGKVMLRCANRVFQELRNASLEVSDLAQLNQGLLRIGAGMTACIYLLPPVIEKFRTKFPKVDLQVETGPVPKLLLKVSDGVLDIAIVTLPVDSPDLEIVPWLQEEMVLVASPKHRLLSNRRLIKPQELTDLRMILFQKGSTTRAVVDNYFGRLGIEPKVAMESESVATIKPLVRVNLGVSILPLVAVAAEAKRGELIYLRFVGERLTREIALAFHKSNYHPKPLFELIEILKRRASKRGKQNTQRMVTGLPPASLLRCAASMNA